MDTATFTQTNSSTIARWLNLAPWLLVPSGCAALVYQVVWVRLLMLSIGSTSVAISTVLSAFFLGMTFGSMLSARIAQGRLTDLKVFAWLELGIGLSGLILLPVLLHLDHGMALLGELGTALWIKFSICLVLLFIPTVCMGATYPVLASALAHQREALGSFLGNLYTLNTAGAVAGALLSGFVLIPHIGLDGSVVMASLFNLFTGLGALLLHRKVRHALLASPDTSGYAAPLQSGSPTSREHWEVGAVLFCTGAIATASQVAWTKYVSIFVGATLYGFSAILGIFLIGIAAGSWYSKRRLLQDATHIAAVAWALLALSVTLLLARVGLTLLPHFVDATNALPHFQQFSKYLLVLAVLFPATFVFGALFPIALSLYCEPVAHLNQRVGRGYAINTLGSIAGSVAAGFWLIPMLGTNRLLTLSVLLCALMAWLLIRYVNPYRTLLLLHGSLTLVVVGALFLPHLDYRPLLSSRLYRFNFDAIQGKTAKFLYLEEGKAGVISLVQYSPLQVKLHNNGMQESYISLHEAVPPPFTETLLGIMPFLLHENAKTAFVVGFGGGNTVRALTLTPVESIRVVELEPAVVSAVAVAYRDTITMLQDSRVELVFNDARNTLLVEDQSYDVIVSQPSHPWLAGSGNLFTREFFQIVATHLNKGGIFAQWINLFNMDSTTLKSIFNAYFEVFPYGFTMAITFSGDMLIFGSHTPIEIDPHRIADRLRMPAIQQALARHGMGEPGQFLQFFATERNELFFAMSRDEVLAVSVGVEANTDTRILSEVRLAGMTVDPEGAEDPYELLRQHIRSAD